MAREFVLHLHVRDYLADTSDLSTEQHGALFRIMMCMAGTDGVAEFDEDRLRRITGLSAKRWPEVWRWIRRYFDVDAGQVRVTADFVTFQSLWSSDGPVYGSDWPNIRARVVARDDGRCTECDADQNLDVHHIRPLRLFGDDLAAAHADDNLVTLCRSCHAAADAEYRRRERGD